MSDDKLKPIEGEVVEPKSLDLARDESETSRQARGENPAPRGIFIGTLNIMTEPGRNFITEPLGKLYRSRYHGKYKRPKHVFAFDLGLVALGAAIATIAIYFSFFFKPFDPIQISFSALPKNPAAGGEVILNYAVSNLSADSIDDATVTFKLPTGVKFKRSSLAYQRDKNAVSFDSIEPQTDVSERLVGELVGNVGQELKVIATLTYKESRTGKSVSKGSVVAIKIASSTVGASFSLPDKIFIGQTISGTVDYWNRGNTPAKNAVLTPHWPDNFTILSLDTALGAGQWQIRSMDPGSAGRINWTGVIRAGSGEVDFRIKTSMKDSSGIALESEGLKSVELVNPQISVSLDGASGATRGQTITLTASYKNSGEHALSGAALRIIPDDGLAIVGDGGKGGIDLAPGANGSWQFKIRLTDALPEALKNATDPQLKVRVSLDGKLDGQEPVSIQSPAFAVKVASALSLNSVARYWSESGDQLGRGPLPPEVGKTTRYWIFWNAKNTTGAVNGVRVSGKLPANASFSGKASVPFGDAPQFDPATRTLTWNAGDLLAWPGVSSPAVGLAFEVALIPTPDQIGTYPLLIFEQKISGIDAVTGLALSGAGPDITARLTADPKAADTGAVK
jgi:hypothetical protein